MQDSELLNRKKRRTSYIPLKSKKGRARENSAVRGVMIIGAGTVSGKYLNYFSKNKRTRLIAVADPSSCVRETPTLRLEHEFFGDKGTMSALSGWDPIRGSQRKLELLTLTGFESVDLNKVRCPDMIDHLLDCILTGSEPLVTAMDARNACAVVEAAYKSIQTGRKINVDWR